MKKNLSYSTIIVFILNVYIFPQLLVENFSYSSGTNLTDNGWIAHSGVGTNPISVNSSGLSFPDYPSSAIGNAALVDNTGEDVHKTFNSVTTGAVYISFLINVSAIANEYFLHLGTESWSTNHKGKIFISNDNSNLKFGLSFGSGTGTFSSNNYTTSTTYLLVLKYSVVDGEKNDEVSLFIFSQDDNFQSEPLTPTIGPLTDASLTDIFPGGVALRQDNSSLNIIIDGIRVATTWSQAPVPVELSSFSAFCNGNSVNLKWQTKTEVENYGFEIERASSLTSPIQDWTKIGFVNGNGNCNSPKDYTFTDKTVTSGKYVYRLKQIDTDGKYEFSKEVEVDLGTPKTFYLGQNYPNPFNPSTKVNYSLPADGEVKLALYTLEGELVKTLVNEKQNAGNYSVEFNAENLSSGMYIYKLMSNGIVQTKKMMLAK